MTVDNLLDEGDLVALELVRFDLPGKTVGYHRGGRPYTYNGLVYLPNRFLMLGDASAALGVAVTTRTIGFSGIPTDDPDDAIAKLEQYDYPNAPVIITYLAGRPGTNDVAGVLFSAIYEIKEVRYPKPATDKQGQKTLTVDIDLEPPGRSARGATKVKRAQGEQHFDNDANDTGLEYAALVDSVVEEWGQVMR